MTLKDNEFVETKNQDDEDVDPLKKVLNFTPEVTEKIKAIKDFSKARGVTLSDDIAPWLLENFHRDLPSLISLIEALDHYSLQTKRSITLPLVRDLLKNKV
jgi:chromosomal replication initiation ATPase DnaA